MPDASSVGQALLALTCRHLKSVQIDPMGGDRRHEYWWIYRSKRHQEVRAVTSADGRFVVAICQRSDGLFCFYTDQLEYDANSEEDLWQPGLLEKGLFGSPDEAEREARSRYRQLD